MSCIPKKNNITLISGSNETLEILLYGVCEKYYPMSSNKNVYDYIVSDIVNKFFKNKKFNISIISHSNLFCNYIHPVESWIKCDFVKDFNSHCLEVCKKQTKNTEEGIIEIPLNAIWKTPESLNEKNNYMSILSETYLNCNYFKKHIKDLEVSEYNILYKNLSRAYESYISLSCDFSVVNLNLKQESKIFVIPSIMEVDKNKNIYTHEERFKQTLKQVKSIREKVKDSVVILCELSFMTLKEIYKISKYTSALIFFNKDSTAINYANDPNKNKAEVYIQNFILTCLSSEPFSHFCKFGGRYKLGNLFDESNFFSDKPAFRIIPKAHDGIPIVESILYSIPFLYRKIFSQILIKMQEILNENFTDVEHLLYYLFTQEFSISIIGLGTLGINGSFAGTGAYNPS